MAFAGCDGFEHGINDETRLNAGSGATGLYGNLFVSNCLAEIIAGAARSGNYGLRFSSVTGTAWALWPSAAVGEIVLSVWIKPASLSSNMRLLYFDGSANDIFLQYDTTNSWCFINYTAGTLNGTTPLTADDWNHIELILDLNQNPWALSWRVNGVAQPSASPAIAAQTVTNFGPSVTQSGVNVDYDDAIWSFTAADGFPGERKIYLVVPDGDGSHSVGTGTFRYTDNNGTNVTNITNGTTDSWSRVSDWPPVADGGTDTRVEKSAGTTDADRVEWTFASMPTNITVDFVKAIACIKASTTSACNLKLIPTVGSTEHATMLFNGSPGIITEIFRVQGYTTAPDTGAWDAGDLSDLRMRFRSNDISPIPQVKAVAYEVAGVPIPRLPEGRSSNKLRALRRASVW